MSLFSLKVVFVRFLYVVVYPCLSCVLSVAYHSILYLSFLLVTVSTLGSYKEPMSAAMNILAHAFSTCRYAFRQGISWEE